MSDTQELKPIPDWKRCGEFSDIIYEKAEGIAKLTINRPHVRNAFRPETVQQLCAAFSDAQSKNRTEKTSGSGNGAGQVSVTEAEAKAAALEAAGLKESQVRGLRIHTDRDDGRTVYEGKFFYNDLEYEFEVDAASGRVTDWDVESIYD